MKTSINLNFQESTVDRPDDASLNRESIVIDNLGNIPTIGDFVSFDTDSVNEVPYKVKTRLFDYSFDERENTWLINANLVVEKQPKELYNKLIKK